MRKALEARAGERDRAEQLGVAVARHDLRRDVLAPQPKPCEHARLEVGARSCVGADRARERTRGNLLEGALQPLGVAVRLEGKARELQPEARRLGVHAVGAPHAECLRLLARPARERPRQLTSAGHDHLARRAELQGERGVEHVGGGQPEVDPAPRLARRCGEHVDEGGHIVVGRTLALVDRRDRERRRADRIELGSAGAVLAEQRRQLLAGGHLDAPPALHARLIAPQ